MHGLLCMCMCMCVLLLRSMCICVSTEYEHRIDHSLDSINHRRYFVLHIEYGVRNGDPF